MSTARSAAAVQRIGRCVAVIALTRESSPGADVALVMWQGQAQSRRKCGSDRAKSRRRCGSPTRSVTEAGFALQRVALQSIAHPLAEGLVAAWIEHGLDWPIEAHLCAHR